MHANQPDDLHTYRVFVAAPASLRAEWHTVRGTILTMSEGVALRRGAVFVPVDEGSTPGGVPRPRAMVEQDLRRCDYAVFVLADRWRDRAESREAGEGLDVEAAYELARECLEDRSFPMREIVVAFKFVPKERLDRPTFHLAQIMSFRRSIEHDDAHHIESFGNVDGLADILRARLGHWLSDHAEAASSDRSHAVDANAETTLDLMSDDTGFDALAPSSPKADLLREAIRLADSGRLAGAEACYGLAVARGDDPRAFLEYGKFLRRVGRVSHAEAQFQRALDFATSSRDDKLKARAMLQLGLLAQMRGHFELAEQFENKSLAISEMIADHKGLAESYSSMGLLHKSRGDLARAELMLRQALAIEERLGRAGGIANGYCNLGLISRRLGDLSRAEEFLRKALDLDRKHGRTEAIANNCSNLGLVLIARHRLDEAEDMIRKALAINESIARLEGMANDYANLGLLLRARGHLDEAERMHLTSLALEEQLGRPEGIARSKQSLGLIARDRGDRAKANSLWTQAAQAYEQLGMTSDVTSVCSLLAGQA